MRTASFMSGMCLLAGVTCAPVGHATGPDIALCRGDYPVLLLTDQECRSYSAQVRSLRARGEGVRLAQLRQQHAAQLKERAAICPCATQRTEPAPQHLVMLTPDC